MEELLHYVWKHKLFLTTSLITTTNHSIEVIDVGLPNHNAGPDFFNAKVKIDDTIWVGNVEMHINSSDWYRHNHHLDKAYDSVILHVVDKADKSIYRTNGELIPQVELVIPQYIQSRFNELYKTSYQPRCYSILSEIDKFNINSWLNALFVERLEDRYQRIIRLFDSKKYLWQDVFFIILARNFGFGLNGDTFERWAKSLPFRALDKHADSLFQVEALMFGLSGLLQTKDSDEYMLALVEEFNYLKTKFNLQDIDYPWKLSKIRPSSFPHIRIAQLAYFYHAQRDIFYQLLEVKEIQSLYDLLDFGVGEYWNDHYQFNKKQHKKSPKKFTNSTKDLLIINTVVPFLYAYGKYKADLEQMSIALELLSEIKPENNYISRMWHQAGIDVANAADSQALIQLQREYCDKRKCIYCRIGYKYLLRKD